MTCFEDFVRNPPVFLCMAMLQLVGQTWRPLFGIFAPNIIFDAVTGWSCSGEWQPRPLYCGYISRGGYVAQLIQRRTRTPLTQVRFPGAERDFSPRVNFQCRLCYGVPTSSCAIACIDICAHVRDPVVRVRVRWITETLRHSACTTGRVARLCRSWLSSEEAPRRHSCKKREEVKRTGEGGK